MNKSQKNMNQFKAGVKSDLQNYEVRNSIFEILNDAINEVLESEDFEGLINDIRSVVNSFVSNYTSLEGEQDLYSMNVAERISVSVKEDCLKEAYDWLDNEFDNFPCFS